MKLLVDHNLPPRLVKLLTDDFPNSTHVSEVGLAEADDVEVLAYAKQHGFDIMTKDADFNDLIALEGFPPRVIWIRVGNCRTDQLIEVVNASRDAILALADDEETGLLVIS